MKITIKSIVGGSLAFLMGLITLLGLCAALGSITIIGMPYGIKENGFNLMSMQSYFYSMLEDDVFVTVVGVFCILQCVAAVALIVFGTLSAFYPAFRRTAGALVIVGLVMQFIYMVLGIVFSVYFNETYWGASSRDTYLVTLAYIPLIFGTLTLIAYFICNNRVSPRLLYAKQRSASGEAVFLQDPERRPSGIDAPKKNDAGARYSESERLELISRYAQL